METVYVKTELKAYKLGARLWKWLSLHPDKRKCNWPLYKFYKIRYMPGECPLCAYYKDTLESCRACHLFPAICNNTYTDAVFGKWFQADNIEESKEAATYIYEVCNKKYELLKKDRKKNR